MPLVFTYSAALVRVIMFKAAYVHQKKGRQRATEREKEGGLKMVRQQGGVTHASKQMHVKRVS